MGSHRSKQMTCPPSFSAASGRQREMQRTRRTGNYGWTDRVQRAALLPRASRSAYIVVNASTTLCPSSNFDMDEVSRRCETDARAKLITSGTESRLLVLVRSEVNLFSLLTKHTDPLLARSHVLRLKLCTTTFAMPRMPCLSSLSPCTDADSRR
jgi:hypothetical protein